MGQFRILCDGDVQAEGPSSSVLQATKRALEIRAEDKSRDREFAVDEFVGGEWRRAVTLHPVAGTV